MVEFFYILTVINILMLPRVVKLLHSYMWLHIFGGVLLGIKQWSFL